jgi:hypothetical protein
VGAVGVVGVADEGERDGHGPERGTDSPLTTIAF